MSFTSASLSFLLFTYTSYPVTPTLSVDAFQLIAAPALVISAAATFAGALGASLSVSTVVNVTASDAFYSFPAASTAVTVTVYSVLSVRPVKV